MCLNEVIKMSMATTTTWQELSATPSPALVMACTLNHLEELLTVIEGEDGLRTIQEMYTSLWIHK